ncbi:MAG: M23 family metallopeptidase [Terricaulis sp.]
MGDGFDGIEIAASEGAPILAAADGDVVYAGADLPAYGTLVLVRHADGFVTAYGYARRALVREGQRVARWGSDWRSGADWRGADAGAVSSATRDGKRRIRCRCWVWALEALLSPLPGQRA